ncbi:MAG: molybdenum cofactor biosynthesis protein MoaE [Lachnospiraceae bacterium]|nr:molybdenum cofactor biosynthesis protein MoaE [Lachnospiraceae bacterium]
MEKPSVDQWLKEAGKEENAEKIGMYLTHVGVVRQTARAQVREGKVDAALVKTLAFSFDAERIKRYRNETLEREGIYYVRLWMNEGILDVGEPIMQVLVGGDIRPHVIEALEFLVGKIKSECVIEKEQPYS